MFRKTLRVLSLGTTTVGKQFLKTINSKNAPCAIGPYV